MHERRKRDLVIRKWCRRRLYGMVDMGESYDVFTVTAVTGHKILQNKLQNVPRLKKCVLEIVKYVRACIYLFLIIHNHADITIGERERTALI